MQEDERERTRGKVRVLVLCTRLGVGQRDSKARSEQAKRDLLRSSYPFGNAASGVKEKHQLGLGFRVKEKHQLGLG